MQVCCLHVNLFKFPASHCIKLVIRAARHIFNLASTKCSMQLNGLKAWARNDLKAVVLLLRQLKCTFFVSKHGNHFLLFLTCCAKADTFFFSVKLYSGLHYLWANGLHFYMR